MEMIGSWISVICNIIAELSDQTTPLTFELDIEIVRHVSNNDDRDMEYHPVSCTQVIIPQT